MAFRINLGSGNSSSILSQVVFQAVTIAEEAIVSQTGPTGPSSSTGPTGPVGSSADTGATGPTGPSSSTGPTGAVGSSGVSGPTGPVGSSGVSGATGPTGPSSSTGPTGATGPTGSFTDPAFAKYFFSTNYTNQVFFAATQVAFAEPLKLALKSGVEGRRPSWSLDGLTWTNTPAYPQSRSCADWSPTLALFSAVEIGGTNINTSVDGQTWTPRPAVVTLFDNSGNGTRLRWSSLFGRFYNGSKDLNNRIYSSTDGITYTLQSSNRRAITFTTGTDRVVAVGDDGPQYTTDGTTWINSISTSSMAGVAYSSTLDLFVGTGRAIPTESYTSTDGGVTWTAHTASLPTNGRALEWVPEFQIFVATGDGGVLISTDGEKFERVFIPGITTKYGSKYIPEWGIFLAVSNNTQISSTPKRFIF